MTGPGGDAGSRYSPDPRDLAAAGRPTASSAPATNDDALAILARRARFSRWDGSQQVPDLDADEILRALSDDMMAEGDLASALRRLMERGWQSGESTRPDLAGLQDLMDRLRQQRQELRERYGLDDVLGDIRRELGDIVEQERAGVQQQLDRAATDAPSPDLGEMLRAAAAKRLDQLDGLPDDVGERIRDLRDYDFMDGDARQRFDELVERLTAQVLDQYVQGMGEAIRSTTPEELDANRAMVRDLNELIRQRIGGQQPDAREFLAKHGRFFPGATSFDDILDQLAQRMAAMQSLMRSMSPEQRAELQSMMDELLRDDRLRADLAELASNLDMLLPGGLGDRIRFNGDESLSLDGALDRIGRLQAMERLEDALSDVEGPADLAALDRDEVQDLLGDDGLRDLDGLQSLARALEEAGYLTRDGEHLELTPRGTRRIGQAVLDDLFARLERDAFGGHRLARSGRGGEREEATKPYEFGDPFHLDLRGTLGNALMREENAPGRRTGRGVRLTPDDFEVYRTEQLTRTATVLLVDMSRSMLLRGCFLAAKKVAVALDTLIRTQYPRDHLSVIGFAYYAREIRPGALAELTWHGYEYGTNLQHGLILARQILARQAAANKEIVVITDGEPTAHFEDGQVEFSYPPTRRTITETLREVRRCTKDGITINTFMLERSKALAEFVNQMTRLNRGRAFFAEPEHLGEYVLVDFVGRRSRRVP